MVSLRRRGAPEARESGSLNGARRARELEALAGGEAVDLLVVGGGITGAWVALDAATRGLSVALVERGDLANGTSRWSSKLAHGGLRYLAHLDFGVAWESASERAVLMDVSAPHLIRALPMLIPLGEHVSPAAGAKLELGVRIGDRMRAAAGTSRRRLPPMRRISTEEARRLAPALSDRGLRGAILHWDGQIEDDARLVLAVARTSAAYGARILTYTRAESLHADGAVVVDVRSGERHELRARHVVNAAGVWAGELSDGIALRPSKGSHLLVRAEALGGPRASVSAPLPGSNGSRFVFIAPRPDGLVLVGLTDEPCSEGPVPDAPQTVDDAEERWLLDSVNRVLERPLRGEDVVGRFAGMRPLVSGGGRDGAAPGGDGVGRTDSAPADDPTADLSRRHAVLEHDGVLTVVGGKLTTGRKMAEDAVDRIAARPDVSARACMTRRLPLIGAVGGVAAVAGELPPALVRRYGAEAERVVAYGREDPALLEPIAPDVAISRAELRFGVEHELALTPDDLLDRRTRLGFVADRRAAALAAAQEALGEALV